MPMELGPKNIRIHFLDEFFEILKWLDYEVNRVSKDGEATEQTFA